MTENFRFSSKTVLYLSLVFLVVQFYGIRYWDSDRVWQHEMKSYYAYLPATFILHDPVLERTEMNEYYRDRFYAPQPGAKHGHIHKTTMGVAFLQAPFFLMGQFVAINYDFAVDGYSEPYRKAAMWGAIFYAFMGLFFIRKTLLRFFADTTVIWVLLSLLLGTNLYFYTLYEGQMSHVYSFFLVSVLVYLSIAWHSDPKPWKLLLLGLVLGMIVLIRPVNGCIGLFFLLYRDATQPTLAAKFRFLFSEWKSVLLAAVCFLLPLLPQLVYWKYTSGSWLFYTYGEESIFWLRPKIWLGLFSYQKGWLVWTPLGWFALLGILLLLRKPFRIFFWPVLVTVAVFMYVIFSWWCWWYGGGFGMRPMIDVLPILAIPLAAFLQQAGRVRLLAVPVLGIWLFLLMLNLFQIRQYSFGKIHWAGTTKKVYWGSFLNDYPKEDLGPYVREPDIEKAIHGETGLD